MRIIHKMVEPQLQKDMVLDSKVFKLFYILNLSIENTAL